MISCGADGERGTPPQTSFGVGVINVALNRYSRSSSLSQCSSSLQAGGRERGRPRALTSAGRDSGVTGSGSGDFSYAVSLDFEVGLLSNVESAYI